MTQDREWGQLVLAIEDTLRQAGVPIVGVHRENGAKVVSGAGFDNTGRLCATVGQQRVKAGRYVHTVNPAHRTILEQAGYTVAEGQTPLNWPIYVVYPTVTP